jgi:D-alanyl-D-alanine carboxypeptidase
MGIRFCEYNGMYKYGVFFKIMLIAGLLLLAAVAVYNYATRKSPLPEDLHGALDTARAEYKLPALAGCVVDSHFIKADVVGTPSLGPPIDLALTLDSYWHIGSNTKAITATLAAILWEEGKLKDDEKLADVFDFPLHADFAAVTLHDLLEHRSGLAAFTAGDEFDVVPEPVDTGTPREQRLKFARWLLAQPPAHAHGEYVYSNAGYGIAAALMEVKTGRAWEDLLQDKLFEPLGMRVHVGWPLTAEVPGPFGHVDEGGTLKPQQINDPYELPAAIDPAGDLCMSIGSYAKFLQLHLRGMRGLDTKDKSGKVILKPETIKELHTPRTGDYACGWIETRMLGLIESSHDGSAGTFYMTATIAADRNVAVAVVTNAGNINAERGTHAVANRMIAAETDRKMKAKAEAAK